MLSIELWSQFFPALSTLLLGYGLLVLTGPVIIELIISFLFRTRQ